MKATGIVRRIDDLGRVVIPKEIRRTMRIREGDPLEIFTDSDGEVVFKKYSPVGELAPFAVQYADVMARACGLPVLICDRDHVIAAAGVSKRDYQDQRISAQMEELMEARQTHTARAGERGRLRPVEGLDRYAGVMVPILALETQAMPTLPLQNAWMPSSAVICNPLLSVSTMSARIW